MKLNKNAFSLAAAGTMGVVYIVCGIFVALWPDFSLRLFGWLTHLVNINQSTGGLTVTPTGFLAGLAQSVIYTYVGAWIFTWLYNRFEK